jgi:hypothetical protein
VADLVTGVGPTIQNLGSKIPGVGGDIAPEQQRARAFLMNSVNDMVKVLQNSPQYAQAERAAIKKEIDIEPKFFDSKKAFENRVIGIDDFMQGVIAREKSFAKNAPTAADRNKLEVNAKEMESFRIILGAPPKINTPEEFNRAPPGRYQVLDPVTGTYVVTNIR